VFEFCADEVAAGGSWAIDGLDIMQVLLRIDLSSLIVYGKKRATS
jgi:hypothetical protein